MIRQSTLLLAILLFYAAQLAAQATLTAQNITVQVSTAEPWTDSGLDLRPGDAVEISTGERDNIGASLQKAGEARTLTHYLPKDPVQDARNATGDGYHSDRKLLVIFLQ